MPHKDITAWKRKKSELERTIKTISQKREKTLYLYHVGKKSAAQQQLRALLELETKELQQAQAELCTISDKISRLEKQQQKYGLFKVVGILGLLLFSILMTTMIAKEYGAGSIFGDGNSLTGAIVSLPEAGESQYTETYPEISIPEQETESFLEEETIEEATTSVLILNKSYLDLTSIPAKPNTGFLKKIKTLDDLIVESKMEHAREQIKEIKQLSYVTDEIVFNNKEKKMLQIHQPLFDGLPFDEAVSLQETDDFTYEAAFEGTAVNIEFDSPEIKQNKIAKQFQKFKESNINSWKIKYEFRLPAEDFASRIRISSNSPITITDPTTADMNMGQFLLSFKEEKANGYDITVDQVNNNIAFVYLTKNYTSDGKKVDDMVVIDPTLTIGSGVTDTQCGNVIAYDTVIVATGGILRICARNATNINQSGWVNFTLGYYGNFTVAAGAMVIGLNGSTGGAGTIQGMNQTGNAGAVSTQPNGGGGSSCTRAGTGDSCGGGGGGNVGQGGAGGISAGGGKGKGGRDYQLPTNFTEDILPGAAGGGASGDSSAAGGSGGGALKVVAGGGGYIGIHGTINVSGINGSNGDATDDSGGGGGAGGTVVLKAGRIVTNGTIVAHGATGGNSSGTTTSDSCGGGGGSGGRILFVYESITNTSLVTRAFGGTNGIDTDANCSTAATLGNSTNGSSGIVVFNFTQFNKLPSIQLMEPADLTTNTTDDTPDFSFNISDDMVNTPFLNCTLWIIPTEGTIQPYGTNNTVNNRTATIITANASLSNGVYNWSINCSDGIEFNTLRSNISVNRTITINVVAADPTAPNVAIVSPASNNTNYSTANILFNATIAEAAISAVNFSFDNATGIDFNISVTNASGTYSTTQAATVFAEGRQMMKVFAIDTAGNFNASTAINFTIDRTTPNVTLNFLNNFVNGTNFSILSSNQTFNASVIDTLTQVESVYFWFDNGTGLDFNVTATNQSGEWVIINVVNVSNLVEGKQGVRVVANDSAGNINNSKFINFTVDFNSPNVSVVTLNNNPGNASNFSIRSSNQTFNFTIFDSFTSVQSVYFWFDNGTGNDFNITAINQSGEWVVNSVNVSNLVEGRQGLRVRANDTVGNVNNTALNFTIDFTTPNVTLNFVNNFVNGSNFSIRSSNQTFNASIFDALTQVNNVYFWFDNGTGQDFNVSATNQSGQWVILNVVNVSNLVEGKQGVRVVANDSVGNMNHTAMINFTVDLNAPNVSIVTVNDNTLSNSSNFSRFSNNRTINVTVFDTATRVENVYLWFDNGTGNDFNVTAVNQSGEWIASYNLSALAEGIQGIRVMANDTVSNLNNSLVINFTTDYTVPNVTNVTPALNSVFNIATAIEISANVTDSLVISSVFANITLPNGSLQLLQLTASAYPTKFNISYTIPLRAGVYNITFIANDTVNNINATGFTNFTGQNTAPVVNFVAPVSPKSITELTISNFSIEFNVTDTDGVADINNNSAQVRINLTGEAERYNTSCSPKLQTSSTSISYMCNISIWYFDGAGNWTINVSINDSSGAYAENRTTNFQVQSTTAMNMYPNALTWATLELGTTNRTSTNDPLLINNTGNSDIAVGGITVTGYDLQGTTTLTDLIGAGNFSIHAVNGSTDCSGDGCLECNGTIMLNNTATAIQVANITAGNNSINDGTGASGQEQLYMCMRLVPLSISRQTYDTSGASTDPWVIAVS